MGWNNDNEEEKGLPVTREALTEEQKAEVKELTGTKGFNYRGIRDETSKYFGVRYEYSVEDGKPVAQYVPCTIDNELVGYRVRRFPKDFSHSIGLVGKTVQLIGQFRFRTHTKTCVIVGGETKLLNTYQMLKEDLERRGKGDWEVPAVVCSTLGESGAHKQVAQEYEFFNQFQKIVVCMDNDEAGREAAQKIAAVLPRGKVFIMTTKYKDPDDFVVDKNGNPVGKEHEFIRDYWASRSWTPDGVKSAAEAFDGIGEELSKPRITLPKFMHKLEAMMGGGIRQGRIVNIAAHTSVGKSLYTRRMVYHWIYNSPEIPTIVSLEDTAGQYMIELLSLHLKENLTWQKSEPEIIEWLQTEEGQKVKHDLCFKEDGTPRFYLIDERSGSIEDIEAQMEVMSKKMGSKLFIIDVLSDLLRGENADKAESHMNFQKIFIKNGNTLVNVMHSRKPGEGKDGKQQKISEYDILGTGSFVQSSAYTILLHRDKMAEDELTRNTTVVEMPKCRGGKTGAVASWVYDWKTSQCYDLDDWLAENGPKGF